MFIFNISLFVHFIYLAEPGLSCSPRDLPCIIHLSLLGISSRACGHTSCGLQA